MLAISSLCDTFYPISTFSLCHGPASRDGVGAAPRLHLRRTDSAKQAGCNILEHPTSGAQSGFKKSSKDGPRKPKKSAQQNVSNRGQPWRILVCAASGAVTRLVLDEFRANTSLCGQRNGDGFRRQRMLLFRAKDDQLPTGLGAGGACGWGSWREPCTARNNPERFCQSGTRRLPWLIIGGRSWTNLAQIADGWVINGSFSLHMAAILCHQGQKMGRLRTRTHTGHLPVKS
jgi:hypothetical protein